MRKRERTSSLSTMRKRRRTLSRFSFKQGDLTSELRKFYLPRGYPMPSELSVGMRLVNTFEEHFDDLDGYKEEHARVKLLASSISNSVVSLASFKGSVRHFACTGIIFGHMPSKMTILTSASLVRCLGDEAKFVNKLEIKVRLPNGKLVVGKLWKYDYNYNIAVVKTNSFPEFHAAHVHNGAQFNSDLFQANLVAIGRCYESGQLMASSGMLLHKTSRLDCQELMVSTCKITKAGIGGPLIDSNGNFVGMTFNAKDETPFLPVSILLKCFKHFEIFGRVVQPWLGLRVGSLGTQKLSICEEIRKSFPQAHGIYVEMVSEGSPAATSGIKVGDLISTLDGVALSNAQEFHELILDKAECALKHSQGMVFKVYVLRPSDCSGFVATVNGEEVAMTKQNRWPVPEVEWLYPSTNDSSDFTMWQDPVTYRAAPLAELYVKNPSGYELHYE
ncbi:unnamed protein product [Urochloa decumbens]|uniref:PDZ domain-containing protein n=1 Tax=Urochloa decumbens TaxID=240449 RepID=A0ABC9G6Q6_9POAL